MKRGIEKQQKKWLKDIEKNYLEKYKVFVDKSALEIIISLGEDYVRLLQSKIIDFGEGFKTRKNFAFSIGKKQVMVLLEREEETKETKIDPETLKRKLKEAYGNIIKILKKYMDLDEENYSLITIWILGTYFHHEFSTYPYLFFNAMKGSGKSRILNIIKTLSKNGRMLNSITEAVLFRTKGMLAIDEFESIGRTGRENLRELLNSAYKKGTEVIRFRKAKSIDGETQEEEHFNVYRPISMANIWGMENVLSDRCIKIILEKSDNPTIVKLIEDFEENEEIQNIVSHLKGICDTSDTTTMLFEHTKKKWNAFVGDITTNQQQVSQVEGGNSVISVTTILFNKIHKYDLSGRDLELFFPLYLVADVCGILEEILETSKKMTRERKEGDREENRDVQLIEFVSGQLDTDFVSVAKLSNDFRESIDSEDKYINSSWTGRALRRLALVKDKRRNGRTRQVKLNIAKAKEKIKMFKEPEELEEKQDELKQDKELPIKHEKIGSTPTAAANKGNQKEDENKHNT